MAHNPFTPGNTVALAVTNASGNVAINLPAAQQIVITNTGAVTAFVAVGLSAVAATATGFPILGGTQVQLTVPQGAVYVAAITSTGSTNLSITSGDGVLNGLGASAAGETSNATIVGPLGQAASAASVPVVLASDYFPNGYSYTNISTDTTTQVKSGAGVLHAVVVNTSGTVASSVSIYDSTSTTTPVVAIINALATGYYIFDAAVTAGIRVVTTGTVAPNVTILWR